MSADVVKLRPADDPDEVLEAAKGALESVLIIGWTKEERPQMYAAASMNLTPADVNMMCDLMKAELMAASVTVE